MLTPTDFFNTALIVIVVAVVLLLIVTFLSGRGRR